MKPAILSIALCLASVWASAQSQPAQRPAWLPSTIGLHLASQHADQGAVNDPRSRGWNNANLGAFIGWQIGSSQIAGASLSHQLIVGGFHNSLYQRSYYIALDTTTPIAHTRLGSFGAALTASAISGYDQMQGAYTGGPIPAGQRVANRCTPATGCRDVLVKNVIRATLVPGIDYKPPAQHAPTLRLQYLHDSSGTGSKAVHLSARWEF